MSILAGIVCRRRDTRVPAATCDTLRQALSRDASDVVCEYRDAAAFLAKVDIQAFGQPAFLAPARGPVSMLAGEPLLATGDPHAARGRSEDLALLHEAWRRNDDGLLATARGVFCAVHYDPATARLSLVADKLGLRPLYYWIGDDYVAYATALRILERLDDVPKRMDVRAVTELACLGVPLGDRTPYDGVRALRAGEIVHVTPGGVARSQYWRWDDITPSRQPEPELLQAAYERFTAAVACRLRNDTVTTAFLSGGLDSRCVVAALRSRGLQVHSFNFGHPGTQDRALGAAFARAAGTRHHEAAVAPRVEPHFSLMLAQALGTPEHRRWPAPERPSIVWSGDGGSFGTGHIYLTRRMVDPLRANGIDDAIDAYLQQQQAAVPRRLLRPGVAAVLDAAPRQGIRDELADLHCADPGRGLYLFVLLNDQRRHLAGHFEDIDLHRLEFEAPFYDSDFLRAILEVPIELCLYHRLYVKWLELFSPVVTAVPWQSYPGHVPCPLPIPAGLRYQWRPPRLRAFRGPQKRALLRRAGEMLHADRFPHELLRKGALRLASWIYRAGLRNYDYLIRHASLYYTYWARCGGRWSAPATGAQHGGTRPTAARPPAVDVPIR